MKDYYSLTEDEKTLLRDYKLWNNGKGITFLIIYIGFLTYFLVMIFGFLFNHSDLIGAGILGMVLIQMGFIWILKKAKKTNRLIFGFDNAKKYFFGIGKKDVKIKVRELITPDKEE